MKTPAFRPFIQAVGKTVHHLNTIAVGLSGVESGACTKPLGMDISWNPVDLKASSRDARAFTLRATIVFVVEELCAYISKILGSPGICEAPKKADRSQKFETLCRFLEFPDNHLILGPLLLIHWRNRIVHKQSRASLTNDQVSELKKSSELIIKEYKNLCVDMLLEHFHKNQPTLKDVSSLIAMTINFIHAVESKVPEPNSKEDFKSWLKHIELLDEFERIERVAACKPNPDQTINNFISTNCPELLDTYAYYYGGSQKGCR